jgi:hypothetical protein
VPAPEIRAATLRVTPCIVTVAVTTAAGAPVSAARVFATRSTDRALDADVWPATWTDEAGRADLRLPAAGRWNIGAEDDLRRAMLTDVAVAPDAPREVRLTLAPNAEVRVVAVGATEGAAWSLALEELESAEGGWPLREEADSRLFQLSSAAGATAVPGGVPLRVLGASVSTHDLGPGLWRPETPVVTAPCTIRLEHWGPERLGHLRVEAVLRGAPDAWRAHAFNFTVREGGQRRRSGHTCAVEVADGEARAVLDLPRPPGTRLTVTVCAPSLDEAVVEAVTPPAGTTRLERVAFPWHRTSLDPWEDRIVVVDAEGEPVSRERFDVRVWAPVGEGGAWTGKVPAGAAGERAVVTAGAWLTSAPFTLPDSGSTRTVVSPGGYALLHTPYGADSRMGRMHIERMDGGWLGTRTDDVGLPPPDDPNAAGSGSDPCGTVHSGALLGPLPAGEVPLRVTLGGVEVGRVTAHIVAGEVTILSLR